MLSLRLTSYPNASMLTSTQETKEGPVYRYINNDTWADVWYAGVHFQRARVLLLPADGVSLRQSQIQGQTVNGALDRTQPARGVFPSVSHLANKIMTYIRLYNRNAQPFRWTYRNPRNSCVTFFGNATLGTAARHCRPADLVHVDFCMAARLGGRIQ